MFRRRLVVSAFAVFLVTGCAQWPASGDVAWAKTAGIDVSVGPRGPLACPTGGARALTPGAVPAAGLSPAAAPGGPASVGLPAGAPGVTQSAYVPKGPLDVVRRSKFGSGLSGLVGGAGDASVGNILRAIPRCPIPPDQMAEIDAHPISAWAKSIPDGGRGLVIQLRNYGGPVVGPAESAKLGTQVPADGQGETLQSHLLATILLRLLPNVTIGGSNDMAYLIAPLRRGGRLIELTVTDDAERAPNSSLDEIVATGEALGHVQMAFFKAANAATASMSKGGVRRLMGIPSQASVVHVYGTFLRKQVYTEDITQRIDQEMDPRIIIRTSMHNTFLRGQQRTERLQTIADAFPTRQVVYLSELKPGQLSTGRWVVVNDVFGVMPLLNRAADRLFVYGAINPLEGLQVGTPTTLILDPRTFRHYSRDVIERAYLPYFLGTGGGNVVQISDVSGGPVTESLTGGKIGTVERPPYQVKGPDGKTPTGRFLDSLQRVLERKVH